MNVDLTHIEVIEPGWTGRVAFSALGCDEPVSDTVDPCYKDLGFLCGPERIGGSIDEDTMSEELDEKLRQLFSDMDIDTQAAENFCLITVGEDENIVDVWATVKSRLLECGAVEVK
jgi:hypothetical protein